MDTTKIHLQAVRSRIADACLLSQRKERDIVLVAVSKAVPAEKIRCAHAAGQRHFGESYAQEALDKMSALADLGDLIWHFIGPIQSNKTRAIAEHFDWVHAVDRLKIAERLSSQRPATKPPLDLCIQVNISGESTKSGVEPAEAGILAQSILRLPRLRLRGLMAIPAPTSDRALRKRQLESLTDLQRTLVAQGLSLDTLSMGMSDDLEEAISAGSTLLRVGTAIFGPRPL
ncbi:MAG TPA: YggS family pyridoxal phosphate-dependent enzyme [Burkholderiales bacterium]|nr:YggS family pyridoxal phosphate-dependent enzyme [Burkholderiales bacterium]